MCKEHYIDGASYIYVCRDICAYNYSCMYVTTINEQRDHKFEKVYRRVWREAREGELYNFIIIKQRRNFFKVMLNKTQNPVGIVYIKKFIIPWVKEKNRRISKDFFFLIPDLAFLDENLGQ